MKRAVGIAGVMAGGVFALAVVGWSATSTPATVAPAPPPRPAASPRGEPADRPPEPVVATPGAAEAPASPEYARRVEALGADCGLDARPLCEGDTCVVAMAMPDMESPLGWAEVALSSPRFVASAAARDLGLGVDLLPCVAAIDGLGGGAAVVESPGGRETWCSGQGPAVDALCARVTGLEGFRSEGVRRLSFRRD